MRVAIVDDEHLARERLQRMIRDLSDYEVVGEAGNGMDAVKLVSDAAPDIVLLDIRMPGMDGLEAAQHISCIDEPPAIVFCTAYEEHAIEAFNVQAVGYLLKPVRKDDLAGALQNAARSNKAQLAALRGDDDARRSHISANTRRGIELVPVDDVRYFQADQKYVTVRHSDGELLIDETLRDLEDEFGEAFLRVHRNCIVAPRFVDGLDRDDEGRFHVRFKGIDDTVAVSRRFVSRVRKFVKAL